MFTLTEDILKLIERQYEYDMENNEDIADDEKKKYMATSTLPDYNFKYKYRGASVDMTLRWIVRDSGYEDCPCELAIEYDFDYCGLHFNSSIGDEVFLDIEAEDMDEELARSYTKQIMDSAELDVFEFEKAEATGDIW